MLFFNSSSVLESVAVQRIFLNKLIDVALAWHQNFPKLPPAPSLFLRCSVHAIKNTRRKMEDKHVALPEFNQLFGIQVQLSLQHRTLPPVARSLVLLLAIPEGSENINIF